MANTRSKRGLSNTSASTTPRQAKRPRGRPAAPRQPVASSNEDNSSRSLDGPPVPSTSQNQSGGPGLAERHRNNDSRLDLPDLSLSNYEQAMEYWPMNRINKVLASQTSSNEKLTVFVLAHAQAVLERFEHTLHMIAMIAGCSVAVLKRRL